jgi:hypothetical protein
MAYKVGDIVFWATGSAAGEYTVIGHVSGEPGVLVFEGGGEVDASFVSRQEDALQTGLGNIGCATFTNFRVSWRATSRAVSLFAGNG